MTRSDTLDLEVLGGIASQLKYLGREVLKDGSTVDGSSGTNPTLGGRAVFQEAVDTSDGELEIILDVYLKSSTR